MMVVEFETAHDALVADVTVSDGRGGMRGLYGGRAVAIRERRLGVVAAHLEVEVRVLVEDGTFHDVLATGVRVVPLAEVDTGWLARMVPLLDSRVVTEMLAR